MNTQLVAEEEIDEFDDFEPEHRPGLSLRDGGTDLFRGVLVALVALAVGALVLSQGFGGDTTESADDSSLTSGELTAADPEASLTTDSTDGTATGDATDPAAPAAGDATNGEAMTDDATTDATVADGTTTPTSDPAQSTSTTAALTDTARPASEVEVVVLNATDRKGIAGQGTELLTAVNYNMVPAGNATESMGSVIYYLEGYRADAIAVSEVFADGLTGLVLPYDPTAPPAPADEIGNAKVIVVLGIDDAIPIG